jgi:plastocyanin
MMKSALSLFPVLFLAACSSSSSSGPGGNDAGVDSATPPQDAGVDSSPGDGGSHTFTVNVSPGGNITFDPPTLAIHAGDTVHWVFQTSGHTVTSGNTTTCASDGKFCSPSDSNCGTASTSNQGTTYDHVFPTAGTFPYFCAVHCGSGMTATITVQ